MSSLGSNWLIYSPRSWLPSCSRPQTARRGIGGRAGGRCGGGRRDRAGWDYQQFLSYSHPPAVHGLAHGKRAGAWEHSGHRGARSGTHWVGAGVPPRPAVTAQTLAFMRIVVSGYYGFGNGGDEAVLEAIVGALRARIPQAQVVVLSAAPDH